MDYGLLGRTLSHSYSPFIHKCFGYYEYGLIEKEPETLCEFMAERAFSGLNVTIPYKKEVLKYCDALSETALRLGAVNTIVKREDGSLIGHNTDYFGFSSMLKLSGLSVTSKKVLVLGSGGASATAVAVLQDAGAEVVVISRGGENNYDNLLLHKDASVLVNATPVGMYPNVGISPLELSVFPKLEGVLDLIYNPARTKLLLDAEAQGLVAINGLWMLVAQAKESAEWFIGKQLDNSVIEKVYRQLKAGMENLILIGMPGCGKSTIGSLLSRRLSMTLVDADAEIVARAGMSIPEIFALYGEERFREIESEVLADIGKKSGQIIATGGGCVTRKVNYASLHQNGTILWLQRNIENLPTEGRPLSMTNSLLDMYQIRKPLYQAFADITIDNNSPAETTVQHIISTLGLEEET